MITTTTKSVEASKNVIDQAARSAEHAIKSTKRVTNGALDGLADGVQDLRDDISPMLNRASEQASALAHLGMDAVREGTQQVRERTAHASAATVAYIRDEPLKSVLIAAATGAALMALIGLFTRART